MPQRVRVKVCGVTCREDAEKAIELGADALGFNTWSGTKRYLDLGAASQWIRELPPFVSRVALCVNASLEEALAVARSPVVDFVQLHGDEDADFCERFAASSGKPFIKAARIRSAADIEQIGSFSTPHVLVDAHVPGQYGGTGAAVNLELAKEIRERFPALRLVLAGGLRPNNVAEAVRYVRPYAVDVSSGVESTPGRKDPALMQAFIDAVRAAY
jgi:phosphoribosylanthranilate isomerase